MLGGYIFNSQFTKQAAGVKSVRNEFCTTLLPTEGLLARRVHAFSSLRVSGRLSRLCVPAFVRELVTNLFPVAGFRPCSDRLGRGGGMLRDGQPPLPATPGQCSRRAKTCGDNVGERDTRWVEQPATVRRHPE